MDPSSNPVSSNVAGLELPDKWKSTAAKNRTKLGDCPACHVWFPEGSHLSFWHLKAPTGKIWCGLFWCLPHYNILQQFCRSPPPVDSQEPTNPGRPRRGSRRTVGDLRTCDQWYGQEMTRTLCNPQWLRRVCSSCPQKLWFGCGLWPLQYILYLGGWTSINHSVFGVHQGFGS